MTVDAPTDGRAAARQRMAAQLPTERKAERADFVVDTGGSLAETDRQVDAIAEALEALGAA